MMIGMREGVATGRDHVRDQRIARIVPLVPPARILEELPLGEREEATVVDGLAQGGVIVRSGKALGDEGHLRVTLGTRAQNERFLAALDPLL